MMTAVATGRMAHLGGVLASHRGSFTSLPTHYGAVTV